jgi:hypothetical protein
MAMDGDVLGQALKAAVSAAAASDPSDRDAMFRAMGNAIVNHLRVYGQVNVTVISVSGVTTGAGVSGPGTGSGTVF